MSKLRTVLYAFAQFAGNIIYWCFITFTQFFYTDVMHVRPQLVGSGLFAFTWWNAINDPLAGWVSDKTSTRWGRRRFWIYAFFLPAVVFFTLIWIPPLGPHPTEMALFVYMMVIISLFDLAHTTVQLNQGALLSNMFEDTNERSTAAAIRFAFGISGVLLGIGISPAIYDKFGWTAMALLWGGVSLVLYIISMFGMRENVDFAHEEQPPFWQAVRVTFANRAYLLFLGVGFMTRLGQSMLTTIIPFYVKYVLRIPDARSSWFLGATFGLAVILMWPWQRIIKRLGTRWSYVVGMTALGICCMPLLIANSFEATLVTCIFISFGYAGLTILPEVMLSEIVDEDHVTVGARREGMYWGLYGFAQRFPIGVANFVFGYLLAWTGYIHPTAAVARPVQLPATVLGIRHYASTGVMVTMLLGIGFALAYPLYGTRLRRAQERVAALRARLRERGAALARDPVGFQTDPLGNGHG